MSSARVIKHKRVDTKTNVEVKNRPTRADTKPASQLKVTCSRKTRASSCPRAIQHGTDPSKKQRIEGEKGERRARSTSAAPTPRAGQKVTAASPKSTDVLMKTPLKTEESLMMPGQKDRATRSYYGLQSHKAFTVIPPNPKKRKEIQKKAEAELAALEDLRLRRAMTYVSINPSSVGGCLSLEEVRLKQQQEMQARRRQKQMRKYLLEATPVLP